MNYYPLEKVLRIQRLAALLLIPIFVGGCASYGPTDRFLGLHRDEVINVLGLPTSERAAGSKLILEYAKGPYGRHTFFITFDSAGRVERWEQVLSIDNFKKILPGMTKDQVRSLIGQSFETIQLARNWGEVWSYRYETTFCVWFQIEFSADGIVRSAGDGIPPECSLDSPP